MKRTVRLGSPTRPGSFRSRLIRAGAAAGVAAAALTLSLVPPTATTAIWTDTEHTSGNFRALTVPAPVILTCTARNVSGPSPRVTLTWSYPSTGYTRANARFWWSASGMGNMASVTEGNGVSTTGPVAEVYTSTFEGGFLSGLLGGSADVGLTAVHASRWTSKMSTAHATFSGTGTCAITNAS